jgi:hypothetical protein
MCQLRSAIIDIEGTGYRSSDKIIAIFRALFKRLVMAAAKVNAFKKFSNSRILSLLPNNPSDRAFYVIAKSAYLFFFD